MNIQRLALKDYKDVMELWDRAQLPYKPKGRDNPDAIAKEMKTNPDFFIGAFEDNKLLGVALLSSDMRRGWINRLAVDPEYRHHGVAERLIVESEKALSKHGLRIFCALIDDWNVPSKRLFKKCGYIEHNGLKYFSKRESDEI